MRADFGWCPRFGYWVELWRRDECRPWLTYELGEANYDSADPAVGALHFLAEHGLLDAADVETAIGRAEEGLRGRNRAAEVLRKFRDASGE